MSVPIKLACPECYLREDVSASTAPPVSCPSCGTDMIPRHAPQSEVRS